MKNPLPPSPGEVARYETIFVEVSETVEAARGGTAVASRSATSR